MNEMRDAISKVNKRFSQDAQSILEINIYTFPFLLIFLLHSAINIIFILKLMTY